MEIIGQKAMDQYILLMGILVASEDFWEIYTNFVNLTLLQKHEFGCRMIGVLFF